ncbi:triacylglycerol lipase [Fusarium austroafricanum]|uniref:Triacylglycerol lipase n=1 Tax=Fusarium austroafricanum TaxID=2364996 RepID=A0A8H4KNU0_9HYPO|nr:triacylglycerol lipase [Fusarium austroafricanum]
MTNTAKRPQLLSISLNHQPFFDQLYEPLLAEIRSKADFWRAEDADSAGRRLSEEPNPAAVLITDEALTVNRNNHLWRAVLQYVREGGRAVVMGNFSSYVKPLSIKPFFAQAGLGWDVGSYHRTTVVLNNAAVESDLAAKMLPRYSQKAQFVKNVASEDAWYVTDEESVIESLVFPPTNARVSGESPVAFASVGDGKLGYIGNVNGEQGSNVAVLAIVLQSEFFEFIVGHEKKKFFLHSSIVACQSESLEKLINGGMKEANERCATLPDVDSDTFVRFSQYAYTGDYQAAEFRIREDVKPRTPSPPPQLAFSGAPKIRKKRMSSSLGDGLAQTKDKDLWAQFKKLYPDSAPYRELQDNNPEDDFSPVFLSHTHLYIFADCYGISALKLLCLRKIQRALKNFTLHEEAIEDVVQLIHFCYENTIESDELRDLLNMYTACKATELWQSQNFQHLVMDIGEYACGLISEMLKRVD